MAPVESNTLENNTGLPDAVVVTSDTRFTRLDEKLKVEDIER